MDPNLDTGYKTVVTESGKIVATLTPSDPAHAAPSFANRKLVPGFNELPAADHDSTESISTDRDRPQQAS
jgi:antitoxin (DNA-binding transcriptional repressor) of toxin-antitoxin stability system